MIEQEKSKYCYRIIQVNKIMYSARIRLGKEYLLEKENQTEYIISIGGNIINILSNQFNKNLLYELLCGYPEDILSQIIQEIQYFYNPKFEYAGISFEIFSQEIEWVCKQTNKFEHLAGGISYCYSYSRLIENGKMLDQTSYKYVVNIVMIPGNIFFEYQTNAFFDIAIALGEWLDICNAKEKQVKDAKLIIDAKAVAQLLNLIIPHFYVDMVLSDEGIINQNMIKREIFPKSVTFISTPEERIFDREGNRCIEKILVEQGVLNTLISDENGCQKIKGIAPGNLSIHSDIELDHYCLKLIYNVITDEEDGLRVLYFTNLNISKENISGFLFYQKDGEIYKSFFSKKINILFQNTIAIKNTYRWINGCFCSDLLYHNTMVNDERSSSV